jgi:hypothetical protein
VLQTINDCKLLQKINPQCAPACQPDQTCNTDGQCIPKPVNQDAGTITISGLKTEVTMSPMVPGKNYFQSIATSDHPVFEEGDKIYLTSTKGYAGILSLHGEGVKYMELKNDQWTLEKDKALAVSWIPPLKNKKSRIIITISVDQHGITPYRIRCNVTDSGSYTIPAKLINALMDGGIKGFPSGKITRRTADSTPVKNGCVEFTVSSSVAPKVRITDIIPCNTTGECPTGQTCNMTTHLCE